MKKVIYFSLLIATMFVVAACSSSSPGAAAKKSAQYMADGKYDKFIDGLAIGRDLSQVIESAGPTQEQREGLASMLKEKGDKALKEKGGIKKIEVLSEEISKDGNTAKVVLLQTYGNGETEESDYDMVKQNGEWKIWMKK